MIRRSPRPTNHYTVIRNDVIRDSRLSFRARGLLIAILSRPDNWTVRSSQLAAETTEGRDAIRTALNELQNCGYLKMERVRLENGQFTTIQVVYDVPLEPHEVPQQASGNQASGNQASVFQASLEVTRINTEKKRDIYSASEDAWNKFWAVYPRKKDKQAALKAWKKALKTGCDPQQIIDGAIRYAEERSTEDPQYTKYPASWLNAGSWENQADQPSAPKATARTAQVDRVQTALERIGRTAQREITQ